MIGKLLKNSLLGLSIVLGLIGAFRQTWATTDHSRISSKLDQDVIRIQTRSEAVNWNAKADAYLHSGPVWKAFECWTKAIATDSTEPVFYQNLATSIFLYRRDAMRYYNIDEQHVFDRALEIYGKAMELDPNNFALATDIAITYYGIKPARPQQALDAWERALNIAANDFEREGVYIHMARVQMSSGRIEEARQSLEKVKDEHHWEMKDLLLRRLAEREAKTNAL